MSENDKNKITFIQYSIPPLKSGEYTISVTQKVTIANQAIDPNSFTANKTFAVPGNRFQLNGDDVVSVFPAPLSNGEFTGMMPLVVLRRDSLPWQRTSIMADPTAPWLALLLCEDDEAPLVKPATAAELFPAGTTIKVAGSTVTGRGTMPSGIASYPGMNPLDYGQSPTDPCSIIDLPVALFSRLCPSVEYLPFLAHVRLTDTYGTTDSDVLEQKFAVVLGNRWPKHDTQAHAFLVSLENMGDLLPDNDCASSAHWPAGTETVRLVCLRTWSFFANSLDEKFRSLCENLNRDSAGILGLTSLRLPAVAPSQTAVTTALAHQATGTLTDADSDVLVQNALCMGYTALDHELREAGHTVSWCRGPLVPYPLAPVEYTIASCPDTLLRYDPQTGMFDVSYAQAWQLGQLLALQSTSFSVSLYTWKQSLRKDAAAQEEMARLTQRMGEGCVMPSFFAKPATTTPSSVPTDIAEWTGRLLLLKGVPFAALVPDERMLPVESLRFFHVDLNWMAAIVDGAFSIGRAGTAGAAKDLAPLVQTKAASQASARRQRKNQQQALATQQVAASDSGFGAVTGCLLRSQLVSGWPGLNINGYADPGGASELPKLRMERLSSDVLICLFEGEVKLLTITEPGEQLHCGAEGDADSGFTTTLREMVGSTPGKQYVDDAGVPVAVTVLVRADMQTLQASATAKAIQSKLNTDYGQNLTTFTSAEFALEMVAGVVDVQYKLQ